jgi:hypothetical protein
MPYTGTRLSLANEKRWFFYLFGLHCLQLRGVNLHSNSWIQQLKKSEWVVGQTVFREDWWQRQRVFFHYQSLITITTIDLRSSNANLLAQIKTKIISHVYYYINLQLFSHKNIKFFLQWLLSTKGLPIFLFLF